MKESTLDSYSDVALVIERKIIICHLGDVPNAFVNQMGLLNMLNPDYPKDLGIGLFTQRVHTLKNKLLS